MIKKKRILVTGVCGFLGHELVRRLVGNNDIIGVDKPGNSTRIQDIIKDIRFIEGDTSSNEIFEKIPKDIDYIFHFGSPASIVLFNKDPQGCFDATVKGMYNILEFAKKNQTGKLVYPSTASIYAGNKIPHIENTYPQPRNMYGAAKLTCESLASAHHNFVKSVGLRIFASYGPGEESKSDFASMVYIFLNDIKNKKNPVIFGDGTQSRDFIYIDDTIDLVLKSTQVDFAGVVNVGSGISTTFNELIQMISTITNVQINPQYIEKKINYVENLRADTNLMNSVFGIKPRSINEGIKKFAEYLGLSN